MLSSRNMQKHLISTFCSLSVGFALSVCFRIPRYLVHKALFINNSMRMEIGRNDIALPKRLHTSSTQFQSLHRNLRYLSKNDIHIYYVRVNNPNTTNEKNVEKKLSQIIEKNKIDTNNNEIIDQKQYETGTHQKADPLETATKQIAIFL